MPEHEISRRQQLKWFLLALLAWSVLAAIPTSSAYIAEGSLGLARWLRVFGYIAPFYYLWALVTPAIYRLSVNGLHPRHGWMRAVAGHVAVAAGLSVAFGSILHFGNWRAWLIGEIAPGFYTMSGFSYGFILLCIYFYTLQERIRRQESLLAEQRHRALELQASLAKSQIEHLRGQMNPHFLFNALNCIGALIETGRNDQAYEALEDLGGLLRTSLEHRDQELVPLSEELEFSRRYVRMEQVRFGERLRIELRVDSAAAQWMVPPFLLQPLIENTVKHAVAPSRSPVTIRIAALRSAGGIDIQVSDDGGGSRLRPTGNGTGVGLENLRKRLELTYGERARLAFEQDETGTQVSLYLPDRDGYPEPKKDSRIEDQGHQIPYLRRAGGVEV